MVPYCGDFPEDATVYIPFNTFDSNDPSASVTITDLADADIKVHKDGGIAQIVTDGATVAINFDGITGNHLITIDTSVHADYATGSEYSVRIEGATIDGASAGINVWIGSFSIERSGGALALLKAALDGNNRVDVGSWLGTAVTTSATTNKPQVDVDSVDDDATAANNLELAFDGTGFGFTGCVMPTVTTLTGHTAQTGDSFARIGAAGASLTDLGGMSTGMQAEVEAECVDALESFDLDHLIQVDAAAEEPTAGTYLDQIMHSSGGQSFNRSTDSLEAIRDNIGNAGVSLTGIQLPNQTMDITGNLSGSVGSVSGNVDGNVSGVVTLADGAHGGAAATLTLLSLTVDNSGGDAVTFTTSNAGSSGLVLQGNAVGHGLKATGGATSGKGILAQGGSPNGIGLAAWGDGIGHGISALSSTGNGVNASVTGASQAAGIAAQGGSTNGPGLQLFGLGGASLPIVNISSVSIAHTAAEILTALTDDDTKIDGSATNAISADWTNGGRLDLLLDAIPTTAMRGTDNANTTTPPTVTEIQAEMEENGASLLDTIRDQIGTAGAGLTDLGGMSTGMKAEVNVEAKDVIATDTIAEIAQGVPSATPTLEDAIMLLYMALRNKLDVATSGTDTLEVHNDAGTRICQKLVTDDGSDYSEAKMISGA